MGILLIVIAEFTKKKIIIINPSLNGYYYSYYTILL